MRHFEKFRMRIEQGVRIKTIGNAANYISREFYSYLKTEEMKRTRAYFMWGYYDKCNKRNQNKNNNNKKREMRQKQCVILLWYSRLHTSHYLFRIHHRFVSLQFCFDEFR